jgi:hypothetical protein
MHRGGTATHHDRKGAAMNNPNAVVGTGSTIGGGALVVLIASRFGVDLSTYEGIVIGGFLGGAVLWVGKLDIKEKGIKGALKSIWSGSGK